MRRADVILNGITLSSVASRGATRQPEAPEFSEAVVLEALQKILSSKEFDASERSRRFLEYVVREVLNGRGDRIKAYCIATEVLGRPASFDPQKDPIVRVEAGRLRRALEHYYLTEGSHDALVIEIPKGGYVASFRARENRTTADELDDPESTGHPVALQGGGGRHRTIAAFVMFMVMAALYVAFQLSGRTTEETSASTEAPLHPPGVIIKPLADLTKTEGSDLLAQGLTERIIERTSRFRDLPVIATDGGTAKPSVRVARYEFGGTVRLTEGTLVVQTRLVDRTDGRVLWADNLETHLKAGHLYNVESEIANQIAAKIGEPNGIIFNADRKNAIETPPENWNAYLCVLHAYAYRATFDAKEHALVRSCLESAVKAYPDFATAWALLSLTYVDEFRFLYPSSQDDGPPPLTRAYEAAKRAIDLDPTNIRGQQALMMTLFFRNDYEEAIAVGRAALSLNPNDMEFKGDYGFRLALFGNWEEGCKLVRDALDTSGRKIGYHKIALSLCHYFKNDLRTAADLMIEAAAVNNISYHIMAAAILAEAGRPTEAAASRRWLQQNASKQLPKILSELPKRLVRPEDSVRFISSLRKAGFDIP